MEVKKMGMTFGEAARHWQFGPNWPGVACGATTRSGQPCKCPAVRGKARCRLHGGRSTGAKTPVGLAKLRALHLKHGRSTTEAKEQAKRWAAVGRAVRAELRTIEREAIASGLLTRDWRDQFDRRRRGDESDEKS